MNKQIILAALAAIACSAALAQAPAGTTRPTGEMNPSASGGAAATNAQNKVDTRTNASSTMPASQTAGSGGATPSAQIDASASGGKAAANAEARVNTRHMMDTNGDGMVSRKEWDAHHAKAWTNMKPKNTGVSTADIDKQNRMVN